MTLKLPKGSAHHENSPLFQLLGASQKLRSADGKSVDGGWVDSLTMKAPGSVHISNGLCGRDDLLDSPTEEENGFADTRIACDIS